MLNLTECTLSIKYTESADNYLKIMPFSFDSAGDQTQGLIHARQAANHGEIALALNFAVFKQTKHAHL